MLRSHLGKSRPSPEGVTSPPAPQGLATCFTTRPGPQECLPNCPHSSFWKPFPHSHVGEGPGRESRWQQAYLPELLDACKDPHHAVDLLLQAPCPVLHPACREQRGVRRACLVMEQPRPAPRGAQKQPPLQKPECTCDSFEIQTWRPRHWRTGGGGGSGLRFKFTERVRQLQEPAGRLLTGKSQPLLPLL